MKQNSQSKKIPRNAICPCGSGRRYKHCCGKIIYSDNINPLIAIFKPLPPETEIYYLDTCVWGSLTHSNATVKSFSAYFQSSNRVAVLSSYSLFELSRAPKKFTERDSLFFEAQDRLYIPCLYDQVIAAELESYPNISELRWLQLSTLVDKNNPAILQNLANDPRFIRTRDDHYQFGLDRFMSLEQFKQNFPPSNGNEYTTEDADFFAWATTVEYLGRYFPHFLLPFKGDANKLEVDIDIQKNILNLVGAYPCGRPWWGRRKAVPLPKTLSEHL